MASIKGASVQPGQLTEQQRQVLVQPGEAAPTGDTLSRIIAEQVAAGDTQAPAVAEAPTPAVPTAPQIDPQATGEAIGEQFGAIQEQREAERVPSLQERLADTTSVPKWDQRKGSEVDLDLDDGGLRTRARAVSNLVSEGQWSPRIGIGQETRAAWKADPAVDIASSEAETRSGQLQGALQRAGAVVNQPTETGNIQSTIDPQFLQLATAVVEHHMSEAAFGKDQVDPASLVAEQFGTITEAQAEVELGKEKAGATVTKASGNSRLGQEINREYQRIKNQAAGRPTDDYQDIGKEEAALIGDMAKEAYAAAFGTGPDPLIKRFQDPETGQVVFQPTPRGLDAFTASSEFRGKMFPRQHVRASKTPLTAGKQIGEGKAYTKKETGRLGAVVDSRVTDQAIRNLGQVANVVNKQRLTLATAMVLPALKADRQDPNLALYREVAGVGQSKANKFAAAQQKNDQAGKPYSAEDNMARLEDKIAQEFYGLVQERNGANYLQYYKQAFNSRIAPQQTRFNPTNSKIVRFATTNAIPAKAVKGNRVYKNLQQMYAMMLVPDADAALPKERVRMLEAATPQMLRDGLRLQKLLRDADPDGSKTEAAAAAVEAGQPISQIDIPTLAFDPEADAELIKKIQKKGADDALAYMDGLIDFAKFHTAMQAGRPYNSFFNTYIDGKTNGLAANGIQMGNYEIAKATGVVRTNATQLLDAGDLRDQLRDALLGELEMNGIPGNKGTVANEYNLVFTELFGSAQPHLKGISRQLHKTTTMTFGYGKDIDAFKYDVYDTIGEMVEADRTQGDGTFADAWEKIVAEGPQDVDQSTGELISAEDTAIGAIMKMYAPALEARMSNDALQARSLMRSVATVNSIMDELMFIDSYTGERLYFGGNESGGYETADIGSYEVTTPEGRQKVTTAQYELNPTSSAIRWETNKLTGELEPKVGQDAYGGAVPGPVQSLDAATVALSASGRSWKRLSDASNGQPYLHTIYDAFKLDAMGYDVMLEEINNNWMKAATEWSYLKSALEGMKENSRKFKEKLKGRDPNELVDTSLQGEARGAGALLATKEDKNGNLFLPVLLKKLATTLPHGVEFASVWDVQAEILETMRQAGWDPKEPEKLTVGQWYKLVETWNKRTNLRGRLEGLIKKTEANKAELAKRVKREGPNYQYYAH